MHRIRQAPDKTFMDVVASTPSSPRPASHRGPMWVAERQLCNAQQLQISFPWKLEEPLEVCTELCSQAWAPRSLRTRARGASWATRQARGGRAVPLLSGESSFTRRRTGMLLFQILLLLLAVFRAGLVPGAGSRRRRREAEDAGSSSSGASPGGRGRMKRRPAVRPRGAGRRRRRRGRRRAAAGAPGAGRLRRGG